MRNQVLVATLLRQLQVFRPTAALLTVSLLLQFSMLTLKLQSLAGAPLLQQPVQLVSTTQSRVFNIDSESSLSPHPSLSGLKAPSSKEIVPADAGLYQDTSKIFDVAAFSRWASKQFSNTSIQSKWLQVPPGDYIFVLPPGGVADVEFAGLRNTKNPSDPGDAWTIDFRGCTFTVPSVPERNGNPPAAIYIAQSNDLRILAGTFGSIVESFILRGK